MSERIEATIELFDWHDERAVVTFSRSRSRGRCELRLSAPGLSKREVHARLCAFFGVPSEVKNYQGTRLPYYTINAAVSGWPVEVEVDGPSVIACRYQGRSLAEAFEE